MFILTPFLSVLALNRFESLRDKCCLLYPLVFELTFLSKRLNISRFSKSATWAIDFHVGNRSRLLHWSFLRIVLQQCYRWNTGDYHLMHFFPPFLIAWSPSRDLHIMLLQIIFCLCVIVTTLLCEKWQIVFRELLESDFKGAQSWHLWVILAP